MENETQNLAQATNASMSLEVAERLPKQITKPLLDTVVMRLGCPPSHAAIVTLLEGRATYSQVVDWRRGRARVPRWAWDYLTALLDQKMALDAAVRASLVNPPIGLGAGSARNILKWNQRRAKEKTQKKNPPIEAG